MRLSDHVTFYDEMNALIKHVVLQQVVFFERSLRVAWHSVFGEPSGRSLIIVLISSLSMPLMSGVAVSTITPPSAHVYIVKSSGETAATNFGTRGRQEQVFRLDILSMRFVFFVLNRRCFSLSRLTCSVIAPHAFPLPAIGPIAIASYHLEEWLQRHYIRLERNIFMITTS